LCGCIVLRNLADFRGQLSFGRNTSRQGRARHENANDCIQHDSKGAAIHELSTD
jgi:hypothetical protein